MIWKRSDTGPFTMAEDDHGDSDGNGIPDGQELIGDPDIIPEALGDWQDETVWLDITPEGEETIQAGLRLSDDGSRMIFSARLLPGNLMKQGPKSCPLWCGFKQR